MNATIENLRIFLEERDIGGFEQVACVDSAIRITGHTQAYRHMTFSTRSRGIGGGFHAMANPLRNGMSRLFRTPRHHDGKFLTAIPGRQVVGSHADLDRISN